jgi:hypothetical protein
MRKGEGESAIVIVGIIIVGVIVLYLYFQNASNLSLPGFLQPGIVYSDDVIQVVDKFIYDQSVFEGQTTTIEFTVVNNGPKDIKGVKVSLDPPTGFKSSIKCGNKPSCNFDLQKGELVDVTIYLTANKGVTQVTSSDIHYSVSYNYDGEREFRIPIVNNKNPPAGQGFLASSNSYGPVHLEYDMPKSRPISGGGSVVYAYSDIPFDISFHVVHVGSSFNHVEPILMSGEMLKFDRLDGFDILRCDKIDKNTKALIEFNNNVGDRLLPFGGFEVPFDFECTFQPNKKEEFYDGIISFKWKYPYKISFFDTLTILPKGEKYREYTDESSSASSPVPGKTEEKAPSTNPPSQPTPGSTGTTVPAGLSITTDKDSYKSGETIKITGTTTPPVSDSTSITIKVTDSGNNIVGIAQPKPSGGSFKVSITPLTTAKKGTLKISVTVGSSGSNSLSEEIEVTLT